MTVKPDTPTSVFRRLWGRVYMVKVEKTSTFFAPEGNSAKMREFHPLNWVVIRAVPLAKIAY